jgi:hypothetical protein
MGFNSGFKGLIKEKGSHDLDIRLRDTKGLTERPTCIGTDRGQTHLLFCSVLFYFYT